MFLILSLLIAFPIAPMGLCYDGVQELARYYPANEVIFAYNSGPNQGHTWLLVDGKPIDSYYGEVPRTRYWLNPEKRFGSFLEMEKYIADTTGYFLLEHIKMNITIIQKSVIGINTYSIVIDPPAT
jgi:hypothetical protein